MGGTGTLRMEPLRMHRGDAGDANYDAVYVARGSKSLEERRRIAAAAAVRWIRFRLKSPLYGNGSPRDRVCVVFDIDDTIISESDDNVIESIASVYTFCKINGVPIYIITARVESTRKDTEKSLRDRGFDEYETLFMIPDDEDVSVGEFKLRARQVVDSKNPISACFGDQFTDHLSSVSPDDKRLQDRLVDVVDDYSDCLTFLRGGTMYVKLPASKYDD